MSFNIPTKMLSPHLFDVEGESVFTIAKIKNSCPRACERSELTEMGSREVPNMYYICEIVRVELASHLLFWHRAQIKMGMGL